MFATFPSQLGDYMNFLSKRALFWVLISGFINPALPFTLLGILMLLDMLHETDNRRNALQAQPEQRQIAGQGQTESMLAGHLWSTLAVNDQTTAAELMRTWLSHPYAQTLQQQVPMDTLMQQLHAWAHSGYLETNGMYWRFTPMGRAYNNSQSQQRSA